MSGHLVNNPHVIQGSDGNAHAIGNVIVMNIDELTQDWHTYCVDINPGVPGPFKFVVNVKEKSPAQPEIKTKDTTGLTTQPEIKTEDSTQVVVKQEDCEEMLCLSDKEQIKRDYIDDDDHHVTPRRIKLLKCRHDPGLYDANGRRNAKVAHVHSYYISPRREEKENIMT